MGLVLGLAAAVGRGAVQSEGPEQFTQAETRRILDHGPWPQPVLRDPSNRVSGNPSAIALGKRLFFDRRMSGDGAMSCAACHMPDRGLTDGLARAYGRAALDRNTPSLWNVGFARWFGWDGAADSLWRQSMKPIVNPIELAADAHHVADVLRSDQVLATAYTETFGALPDPAQADDTLLVNTGKALAAYLETLVSQRSAFDDFRDALAKGDEVAAAQYPLAARRGLKIFVGKGNCALCHSGPAFTNGDFGDTGTSRAVGKGRVDAGRRGGVKELAADPFNLLGRYDDDASGAAAAKTRRAALERPGPGEFKVPGLRNVALTMPYMHDGSLATLRDVVRHYSEPDVMQRDAIGQPRLRPLHLTQQEVDDLVAFLESLTDRSLLADPGKLRPPQ
jgi:cytochrome c peroxidase